MDGEIEFDDEGRVFLVEQFPNGDGSTHERKIFLLQISKKGEVLVDGKVVDRVQPFPMRYGSGTIRDGKLVFNDIRQHTNRKTINHTCRQTVRRHSRAKSLHRAMRARPAHKEKLNLEPNTVQGV